MSTSHASQMADPQRQSESAPRVPTSAKSQRSPFTSLLQLQRSAGNRAVSRLLQSTGKGAIQTKLSVRQPGDEFEQNADRVADQIMRMPEPQFQRNSDRAGACPKCGKKPRRLEEHEHVQTKLVPTGGNIPSAVPPVVDEVLAAPGQPLDPATRSFFEPRFGLDFSDVRVHLGEAAAQSAQQLNAHAYAVGNNIVFGQGRFAPGTDEGRQLLAHELTHVVQAGSVGLIPAHPSSSVEELEHEARQVAGAVRSDTAVPAIHASSRGLSIPLREGPEDLGKGTFGNLPGDKPDPIGIRKRVELFEEDGLWYERWPTKRRARGSYDFVTQEGKIWAVKGSPVVGKPNAGHTEAALGGRVEYAGTVRFEAGTVKVWSNASGHYAPVPSFAKNAGFPIDKFERVKGGFPEMGPQLPVIQPRNGEHSIPSGGHGTVAAPGISTGEAVLENPIRGGRPPSPRRLVSASPEIAGRQRRMVSSLESQTARTARFGSKIKAVSAIATGVFSLAGGIAFGMLTSKVAEAHEKAKSIADNAREAKSWSEEVVSEIDLPSIVILIGDAQARHDTEALFNLSDSTGNLARDLAERHGEFTRLAGEAGIRRQALAEVARVSEQAMMLPSDTAQVEAFSFWQAVEPLSNTMGAIADGYRDAADKLEAYVLYLQGLSDSANSIAWGEVFQSLVEESNKRQAAAAAAKQQQAAAAPPPTNPSTNAHAPVSTPGLNSGPRVSQLPDPGPMPTVCPSCHKGNFPQERGNIPSFQTPGSESEEMKRMRKFIVDYRSP